MSKDLFIAKRYCGPSASGQGGYVCGLVGSLIQGPAEVTLRVPPPLERKLSLLMTEDRGWKLMDGDTTVAEAAPVSFEMDIPSPPSFAEAQEASRSYLGFTSHPFPECFVCGPARAANDGMRIFPGQVPGTGQVAAPWTPDASLCGNGGTVRPEYLWAALDCPGAFGAMAGTPRVIVLGKLAVEILRDVRSGERCVVTGWKIAEEGRKSFTGTAVFSESSGLCARAKAVWIELK